MACRIRDVGAGRHNHRLPHTQAVERDVDLTVVSVPGKEVSLHECLADVYMVTEHVVLSRQGKNSAEPAGVRHRAESVFKVAQACVVLSAHVLKPGGEILVLWGKRRSEDLYPALATIESVHFRCFSYEPRWLERTTEHLCAVLWILHAASVSLPGPLRGVGSSASRSLKSFAPS